MLELPRIYAENGQRWLAEMLFFCKATIGIAAAAFVLAVLIGLVVALCRTSRFRFLRGIAATYVEIGRGLPILVILYIVYFVPPQLAPGLSWGWMNAFVGSVLGIGIHGGAILGEVFRSGIEALHRGQMEAALSLGMTPAKGMRYIILPQALRIVLPPVANYSIGSLKDTSVCSLIGMNELMNDAKSIASAEYMPLAVYVLAAFIYFVMSYPLSVCARAVEARLGRGR